MSTNSNSLSSLPTGTAHDDSAATNTYVIKWKRKHQLGVLEMRLTGDHPILFGCKDNGSGNVFERRDAEELYDILRNSPEGTEINLLLLNPWTMEPETHKMYQSSTSKDFEIFPDHGKARSDEFYDIKCVGSESMNPFIGFMPSSQKSELYTQNNMSNNIEIETEIGFLLKDCSAVSPGSLVMTSKGTAELVYTRVSSTAWDVWSLDGLNSARIPGSVKLFYTSKFRRARDVNMFDAASPEKLANKVCSKVLDEPSNVMLMGTDEPSNSQMRVEEQSSYGSLFLVFVDDENNFVSKPAVIVPSTEKAYDLTFKNQVVLTIGDLWCQNG
jgi:hypothetical protein